MVVVVVVVGVQVNPSGSATGGTQTTETLDILSVASLAIILSRERIINLRKTLCRVKE